MVHTDLDPSLTDEQLREHGISCPDGGLAAWPTTCSAAVLDGSAIGLKNGVPARRNLPPALRTAPLGAVRPIPHRCWHEPCGRLPRGTKSHLQNCLRSTRRQRLLRGRFPQSPPPPPSPPPTPPPKLPAAAAAVAAAEGSLPPDQSETHGVLGVLIPVASRRSPPSRSAGSLSAPPRATAALDAAAAAPDPNRPAASSSSRPSASPSRAC